MEGLRVSVSTLGCKLNYAESSTYMRELTALGCTIVPPSAEADIIIVNTCSVTEHSDKKGRNIIRRLHHRSPSAIIAVVGCYAQLKGEEIAAIEGVDIVLGAHRKGDVVKEVMKLVEERRKLNPSASNPCIENTGITHEAPRTPETARTSEISETSEASDRNPSHSCELLDVPYIDDVTNIFAAYSSGERTRSFLKIQDGCDYKCSYCTVPYARGNSRSMPIPTVIAQAKEIAAQGIKEVVLTGVNTGDFGRKTGESFLDLLQQLNAVEGIERYRISSIEPNLLREEIIDWIASGTKFLPHFHIPLQSGCDTVLRRMGRRYLTDDFRRKIEYIRSRMDHVFFGIDVIVGFPGESEEEFRQTYRFLEEIAPAFIHIFPYSRRAGTPAAQMPNQVAEAIKTQRVEELEALCSRLHEAFVQSNAGRTEQVLFESNTRDGKMYGYTRNYIHVERPLDPALIGHIAEVIL